MPYADLSTINISSGIGPTLVYVDNAMQNWFFRIILIGVFLILSLGVYRKNQDFATGIAVGSFITAIISGLMAIAGWIDPLTVAFSIVIMVVCVLVFLFSDKKY